MVSIEVGNTLLNISKVVCVGRNYVAHARELDNEVPGEPVLFLKPPSSVIFDGEPIVIPPGVGRVHHEIELGIIMGRRTTRVDEASALDHVAGYNILVDVTARDLQSRAKEKGLPWSVAKGYDTFCPMSKAIPARDMDEPRKLRLWLKVNGKTRQDGSTSLMIFDVRRLISHISGIMTLEPGDVIATGTPAGVGVIEAGDTITAGLEGYLTLTCPVVLGH